jgi:septal ring factor EnvC (AmiA/AmiB activator)
MNTRQISRFMGVFWMAVSLFWAGLGVWGLLTGLDWLESTQDALDENLALAVDSLDAMENLLIETTDAVSATSQSLTTTVSSLENASAALSDMRPLIAKTSEVVTEQVPEALDGIQDSMPTLISTAKSVDETLRWLSGFGFTVPIPFGTDLHYDLGIDYAPEVPLDQALEEMSDNLKDTPDDLRAMQDDLDIVDADLLLISDDLTRLSDDIDALNMQLRQTGPQLSTLAANTAAIRESFSAAQMGVPKVFSTLARLLRWALVLLLVGQIPFLYMGWLLASGKLFPATHDSSTT